MPNYYELFHIERNATAQQVESLFRRYVARYRPTSNIEGLFGDTRFVTHLNAYLTLHGDSRAAYDANLKLPEGKQPPAPTPFSDLSLADRRLLMARVAHWRRENQEAMHLLRTLLEREPNTAAGWALMGEIHFSVSKLAEGIQAYHRAVKADPGSNKYALRLRQAQDAQAGKGHLSVEESPEEEMVREERRRRFAVTGLITLVGLTVIAAGFKLPVMPREGFLSVPWLTVLILMLGVAIIMYGLAFGRVLQTFERVMVWNSVGAMDRARQKSFPQAILFLVTGVTCIWFAVATLVVIGFSDEEWPTQQSVLVGLCVAVAASLAAALHFHHQMNWIPSAIVAGNLPLLGGMIGWWLGSLGIVEYN